MNNNIYTIPINGRYIIYSPTRSSAFFASIEAKNIIEKAIKKEKLSESEEKSLAYQRYVQLLEKKERRISSNDEKDIKYSTITLLLTDDCNLQCSYCFSAESRKSNTIDKDSLFKFLNDLFKAIPNNINPRFVFMGGGEPLTKWKLLTETVAHILKLSETYDRSAKFSITTNGTLLNNEKILFFKKHGFSINLSFDILPEIQNAQRSNNGINSFEIVNRNISLLKEHNIPFSIRSTITNINVGLQQEMVEFVHNNYPYIKRLHLEPVTNSSTESIWEKFIDNFIQARKLGKNYNINVVCSISNSLNTLRKVFCPGEFTVTAEGNIVSCHRITSNDDNNISFSKYGYIYKDGFVVDSNMYKTQKNEIKNNYKYSCTGCFAELHCAGYCPQAILSTIDNNFSMDKMCGYIKKLLTNVLEQELSTKTNSLTN